MALILAIAVWLLPAAIHPAAGARGLARDPIVSAVIQNTVEWSYDSRTKMWDVAGRKIVQQPNQIFEVDVVVFGAGGGGSQSCSVSCWNGCCCGSTTPPPKANPGSGEHDDETPHPPPTHMPLAPNDVHCTRAHAPVVNTPQCWPCKLPTRT